MEKNTKSGYSTGSLPHFSEKMPLGIKVILILLALNLLLFLLVFLSPPKEIYFLNLVNLSGYAAFVVLAAFFVIIAISIYGLIYRLKWAFPIVLFYFLFAILESIIELVRLPVNYSFVMDLSPIDRTPEILIIIQIAIKIIICYYLIKHRKYFEVGGSSG